MNGAPRWIHRVYAFFNGYFWTPCPICREPFGGHEKHGEVGLIFKQTVSPLGGFKQNTSWSVCKNPACSIEAHKRNVANGYE